MSRAAASVLTLVFLVALSAPAAAKPFTIEATGNPNGFGKVRAIGDFHPQRSATLAAATRVFGPPSAAVGTSDVSCRVVWQGIGLRVAFVNLGGGGGCTSEFTKSQTARAFDSRWRTGRGLRIGAPLGRLRKLYPGATRHGRSWWLVKGVNLYGVGQNPYPVLRATMADGRVRSFALSIGAAGE